MDEGKHHYSAFILICFVQLITCEDYLPGHMQPLGSHLPPLEIDTLDSPPDPSIFHSAYVKRNLPVKLEGLLKDNKVLKDWQNDGYLKQHFGRAHIGIEIAKKENRSNYGTVMEFSEFLNRYKAEDIYMVSDMPAEMTKEWPLPSFLLCGGYTENIAFVYMWFSSGGTKSVLHTDSFENFHCVVSGTKHFVLIEGKYSKIIGPEHESQGFYNLDVEAVDMNQYPGLAEIPWYKVIIEPGDCLYLPYEWIHHVHSHERNMGVNMWWIPFQFNEEECSLQKPNHEFAFIGDFPTSPQLQLKAFLLRSARDDGTIHASNVLEVLSKRQGDIANLDAIVEVMEILVPGSNGLIHKDDLSIDKVPLIKYQEAMEFVMQTVAPPPKHPEDQEYGEGGGNGHPQTRDEL